MLVAALQTARGGSVGVPGKNTLPVRGRPLFAHSLRAALRTPEIDGVWTSTDVPEIAAWAKASGCRVIDRPVELRGPSASHHETILHGLGRIEAEWGRQLDALVILLGNAAGAAAADLSAAVGALRDDAGLDSVESVSPFPMFNPFRALCRTEAGLLETIVPQAWIRRHSSGLANDRRAAGEVLFFNGSFWAVRRRALLVDDGLLPFPWLGKRILPYVQPPRMELDEPWQLAVLAQQPEDA